MARLIVFNAVSLDGYFSGIDGDMSWAHSRDPEWHRFEQENAKSGGLLLFGRITYELMAGFWPTPQAKKSYPIVAERMNNLPKVVFSRTLDGAAWNNTTLFSENLAAEVQKLKRESRLDVVILGSGSLVSQLAREHLIEEYQVVVCPIVLGKGRTMFDGVTERLPLKLTKTCSFGNGNVLLCYESPRDEAEAS
jgi:dihydrofolate reductase